ncbi:hypothetical protein [Persephonella sp. IF05-L8]
MTLTSFEGFFDGLYFCHYFCEDRTYKHTPDIKNHLDYMPDPLFFSIK